VLWRLGGGRQTDSFGLLDSELDCRTEIIFKGEGFWIRSSSMHNTKTTLSPKEWRLPSHLANFFEN
jgi:hypothetical protein